MLVDPTREKPVNLLAMVSMYPKRQKLVIVGFLLMGPFREKPVVKMTSTVFCSLHKHLRTLD